MANGDPTGRGRASAGRRRRWSWQLGLLAVLVPTLGIVGCDLPPGFYDEVVFGGLDRPTAVEISPDGRVYVAEKRGVVKVYDGVDDTTASIAADLRVPVYNFLDRGLLDIALHPDFPGVPYLYVTYTLDAGLDGVVPRWGGTTDVDPCPSPPGANGDGCVVTARVSRLQISPTGTMVGSEQVLVQGWCQQYPSHSIGTLAFGADGALYAGGGEGASYQWADYGQDGTPPNPCGDPGAQPNGTMVPPTAEGGALRSQDLRTPGDPTGLSGSIIRIDPMTGAALPTNPLAGSADPNARRIVAYGLRNPFRFAPRPGTNELWIGDVGWNRWEEIDVSQGDDAVVDNFGWPCNEGAGPHARYDDLDLDICEDLKADGGSTAPRYSYDHGQPIAKDDCPPENGSALSGIAFTPEETSYPTTYSGALFFADAARGCIFVMRKGPDGRPDPTKVGKFAKADSPVELEFGPGGELWYVDLYGGEIHRIGYKPNNTPPQVAVTATPTSGDPPLTVTFDASASHDSDAGDSLSFVWDLDGDGDLDDATGPVATATFTSIGTRTVTVQATDQAGSTDTTSISIRVGTGDPVGFVTTPEVTTTFAVGEVVTFSGGVGEPGGAQVDPSELGWWADLLHCTTPDDCHRHPDLLQLQGTTTGSFVMPDHDYPAYIELNVGALVDGEPITHSHRIDYTTVGTTLAIDPPLDDVEVALGQLQGPAPYTRQLPVGSRVSVSAPATVDGPDGPLLFDSWSDGGSRNHEIVVADEPTALTAHYIPAPP